ncbi:MAG: class II fructose-1,6-bisphosphate aldolase [Firmicutes bacterium]|nr:class II fructose-1,6-bisphosphate aldolase [Bacillota bacterium]
MLENMKEMLLKAKEHKYAVPHFNINNLEWAKFILEECESLKSPVILGVSEGATKYMGGYNVVADMVKALLKSLNITVPVALHLDHGSDFDNCKKAIDAGFTSVMIDASKHCLSENIKITKEVVDYANKSNVSVEAEIGHIGGEEDGVNGGILYADTFECIKLVNETGIDALAPALGSVHGLYKGEPKLAFDRMEEIGNKTNMPLVLHGGTGIPEAQIKKAIECGTTKINVNTELQIAWTSGVRNLLNNDDKVYDPRKVIKGGEKGMKQAIKDKVELFGSINQA